MVSDATLDCSAENVGCVGGGHDRGVFEHRPPLLHLNLRWKERWTEGQQEREIGKDLSRESGGSTHDTAREQRIDESVIHGRASASSGDKLEGSPVGDYGFPSLRPLCLQTVSR